MRFLGVVFLLLLVAPGRFANASAELLTYKGYIELAGQLAPKVDLFKDIWSQDPDAGIYAGTSRDFLYWILKQFREATTTEQVNKIRNQLLARDRIEVREFVMRESDVDVLSWHYLKIDPTAYHVQKVDMINASRLDPNTTFGQTEIDQGFIPAEKIVLGRHGVRNLPQFGDGAREIFEGRLTVHFTPWEVFKNTHYARMNANHPILLALRYLRLLAVDEYNRFGKGVSFRQISDLMDSATEAQIRDIVDTALNGHELQPYLMNESFVRWLNSTIRRAYRSYSNVNLANTLMLHFRINELPSRYPEIKFINNYLFARSWDWGAIEKNIATYHVDEAEFFRPPESMLPGLKGYHGTRPERNFDNIIMQGILPSTHGTAGEGTYMVSRPDVQFAVQWNGGNEKLVVELSFDPNLRMVDIRGGEGSRVFNAFSEQHYGREVIEDFVEAFGIDILCYPYRPTAFVIKNSEVIVGINGAYRTVLTFAKARERAQNLTTPRELSSLITEMDATDLTTSDKKTILKDVRHVFNKEDLIQTMKAIPARALPLLFELTLSSDHFLELLRAARGSLPNSVFVSILDNIEPTRFARETIDDAVFLDLFRFMNRDPEVTVMFPVLLERVDNAEYADMVIKMLKSKGPHHTAALLGLTRALSRNNVLPLHQSKLPEALYADHFPDSSRLLLSLLFLQGNYDYQVSLQTLAESFRDLNVVTDKDGIQSLGHANKEEIRFDDLNPTEMILVLESLRAAAKFITVVAPQRLPEATEKAFNLWPHLRFGAKESLDVLAKFQIGWIHNLEPMQRSQIAKGYLEALMNTAWADLPEPISRSVKLLMQWTPEAFLQLADHPEIQKLATVQQLIVMPVRHPEGLPAILKTIKADLPRALIALKMIEANTEIETAFPIITKVLSHYRLNRDGDVCLNGGTNLSARDYLLFVCRFLGATANLPDLSKKWTQEISKLNMVPKELEDQPINIEIEAFKWSLLLNRPANDPRSTMRVIQRTVLNPKKSKIQRFSAARAIRTFDSSGPTSTLLAQQLRKQFQKKSRRFFWQRHMDFAAFFKEDNHLYLDLYRHLGVQDSAVSDFLYSAFTDKVSPALSTAQATSYLLELDIREKRFEEPLTRLLSKTAAKNMELYFKALVTLFPQSTSAILEALYVGHFVREQFVQYLKILVDAAIRDPAFLERLTQARVSGLIPVKRQMAVEGLYLDDWIGRQLSHRSDVCAKALQAAS